MKEKRKNYNYIKGQIDLLKLDNLQKLRERLFLCKKTLSNLESAKELFIVIYIPSQLLLWSLNSLEFIRTAAMIFFTVIFALLIKSLNDNIFYIKTEIEILEESINNYYKG